MANLAVGDQVGVALAVPCLDVVKAVMFVGRGQKSLGEKDKRFGVNRQLAGFGVKQSAFRPDHVAEVEKLEQRPSAVIDFVRSNVNLKQFATVAEANKLGLSHLVNGVHPTRDSHVHAFRLKLPQLPNS